MTLREATLEAHRRMGHDPRRVEQSERLADLAIPGAGIDDPIPPGDEEAIIEFIIRLFATAATLTPEQRRERFGPKLPPDRN